MTFTHIPADWPIHVHRDDFLDSLLVTHGEHPQSLSVRLDLHPNVELGVVLAGEIERIFTDTTMTLRAGDVWLQAMWEPHGFRIPTPGHRCVVLLFLPGFLGEEMVGELPWFALFAAPPRRRPRVRSEEARAEVLGLAEKIAKEAELKRPDWQCVIRLNLLQLLYVLKREWTSPGGEAREPGAYAGNLARIMPAVTRLCADPSERFTLSEAAAACALGVSWFSEVFRKTMGVTFAQFRLNARLTHAARQLIETDLSIEDVAARCAFGDRSNFHHQFRRHYHCTPAEYRRRFRASSGKLEEDSPES